MLIEICEGWRTFRSTRWLWATTASFAVINLVGTGTWQILGPELATAPVWGMALSVRAIGALLMGVLLYRIAPQRFLCAGQILAAFGRVRASGLGGGLSAPWFLLCAFVSGLGFAAPSIAWDSCVHQHVPDRSSPASRHTTICCPTPVSPSDSYSSDRPRHGWGRPPSLCTRESDLWPQHSRRSAVARSVNSPCNPRGETRVARAIPDEPDADRIRIEISAPEAIVACFLGRKAAGIIGRLPTPPSG